MAEGPTQVVAGDDTRFPTVLLVDDEPQLVRALHRLIAPEGFRVSEAADVTAMVDALRHQPELVLLDLQLGEISGVDLIAGIRESCPDTEVIMMTGYATIDSAVACMRAGAFDYLEKPFSDRHRVVQTLRRALERRALRVRNRELQGELDRRSALDGVVIESPAMRKVARMIMDLSHNESNVLIEAESGTGKELIARAIHRNSPRREGPFVPVNCGALPEGIVEAELFGYEAGAFTGAVRSSAGLFRSADNGTLFLDEIGELPLALQVKLLRAIQEREVRPLGAGSSVSVSVRILAATNRDLEQEVREGRFRSDLYYRLRVVAIQLPPLRERREEIPLLALHFLNRFRDRSEVEGFDPEAIEALISHPWVGNIRELENTIEAAVALARGPRLTKFDLALNPPSAAPADVSALPGVPLSLAAYERCCLKKALEQADGEVMSAAKLLGIGRSTMYRKVRQYKLAG
jgi:two-component system response regulator HydG